MSVRVHITIHVKSSLTETPAVCSCTERHPVVSVCGHSQKGHSEPAGAGGAGDVQPGVISGERDGRGGGRLHGHLSLWRPCVRAETERGQDFCRSLASLCQTLCPCLKKRNGTCHCSRFCWCYCSLTCIIKKHSQTEKKKMQYSHRLSCQCCSARQQRWHVWQTMMALVSQHVCNVPFMHITHQLISCTQLDLARKTFSL